MPKGYQSYLWHGPRSILYLADGWMDAGDGPESLSDALLDKAWLQAPPTVAPRYTIPRALATFPDDC
jgi:hypothetical protein